MQRLKILSRAAWVLWLAALSALASPEKIQLPERYKTWLETEVPYIITPRERDIFLKLETDREREAFIEAFWKQRDPTPGTPDNEFKTEHYRRIAYANSTYSRGAMKPGWMTDRGHVYIVLGPPRNIETYDDVNGVYPVEIWFYQPEKTVALPPAFNVIFFKEHGLGDYVFYSPAQHGPRSLIAESMESYQDDVSAYRALKTLAPTLASQTLSLIPTEHVPVGSFSLASNTLMQDIFNEPRKAIDDAYAEALLKYKDSVEVEYTANYIGCAVQALVARAESGNFLVHYSIEPQKLSLEAFENRYSANFDLNGRLTDAADRTVYQFDKQFAVNLDAAELEQARGSSVALQDMFPVLPGRYKFDLLIKNTVSKEFATYETELTVPAVSSPSPVLGVPLLAYDVLASPAAAGEEIPFKLGGRQALSQSRNSFVPGDTLRVVFQVYGLPADWESSGQIRFVYLKDGKPFLSQSVKPAEIKAGETCIEPQSLAQFPAGYYDLNISLLNPAGQEVQSQSAHFTVSILPKLPRPRVLAKVIRPENKSEWDYALGLQSLNTGAFEQARAFLAKAQAQKPGEAAYALTYVQALYILKDYLKAEQVLLPLLKQDPVVPDIYSWLGRTSHALGRYGEAIGYYQEYLNRAGTNLEILNYIGSCYYLMGDKAQAVATWRKSLAINPNQEQIRKLVDSLIK